MNSVNSNRSSVTSYLKLAGYLLSKAGHLFLNKRTQLFPLMIIACINEPLVHNLADPIPTINNTPDLTQPWIEDTIQQTEQIQSDVLFVIDNSGSMYEEQSLLRASTPVFMNRLVTSGVDYHVAVVTTDMEDPTQSGKFQGDPLFIDTLTPNPSLALDRAATLGISGSGNEQGVLAAWDALHAPLVNNYNQGFLRSDAELHIITISDETDFSWTPSNDQFISWTDDLKSQGKDVSYSAITRLSTTECIHNDLGFFQTKYETLSNAICGITHDICSDDWARVIDDLGIMISGLRNQFYLSQVPKPETLSVWAEGHGYRYEGTPDTGGFDPCETYVCFIYDLEPVTNSITTRDFYLESGMTLHIRYQEMQ